MKSFQPSDFRAIPSEAADITKGSPLCPVQIPDPENHELKKIFVVLSHQIWGHYEVSALIFSLICENQNLLKEKN